LTVLDEVAAERERQTMKWGEQNHPDGTGPDSTPLFANTATGIADDDEAHLIRDMLKGRTDWRFSIDGGDRPGTWTDILLEEVFEALAEANAAKLRTELIQVAAVATQWVEAIDRRKPDATLEVRVFTKPSCGPCTATKAALTDKGVTFAEVDATTPENVAYLRTLGFQQAPVVVVTRQGVYLGKWSGFRPDAIDDLVNGRIGGEG
jgi:glutaredoxin